MKINVILLWLSLIFFASCNKDQNIHYTNMNLKVQYSIDGIPLYKDTVRYLNTAGNLYSINHLEYYISDIVLHQENNSGDYSNNKIYYVNAFTESTNSIQLDSVPIGNYTSFSCKVGLLPNQNISNSLPNTNENINMAWPEPMGGGYHFMKLEGFVSTTTGNLGYSIHLGSDVGLVNCNINKSIDVFNDKTDFILTMNINEWYRNPSVYNIVIDGNHTMNNPVLISKIAANGYNIFNLE